jgi:hypothetical protein
MIIKIMEIILRLDCVQLGQRGMEAYRIIGGQTSSFRRR